MGSSCAVPDEKRGMPRGFTLTSRANAGAGMSDPRGENQWTLRDSHALVIESVGQRARGRGVGVGLAGPALFLPANPK